MSDKLFTITLPNKGTLTFNWQTLKWIADKPSSRIFAEIANFISEDIGWGPENGPIGFPQAIAITERIKGSIAHVPPNPEKPGMIY